MKPSASKTGRRQTFTEFRELQKMAFSVIRRPLSAANEMQPRWVDGRPTAEVVAGFIKPNDRLTSLERLEIYNKQYWFRLLDCLYDDYPGLRAILGEARFRKLRIAYLDQYPSRSFTMRNLGSRLVEFLEAQPRYIAPRVQMCMDMARFEWAQVVAFDGAQRPPLTPDDLLGRDPAKLRLGVQPYITALELAYPLDEFVLALKKKSLRGEASNAMEMEEQTARRQRAVRLPRVAQTFVAVHRWKNSLYYKRLDAPGYRMLTALRNGECVADACGAAIGDDEGETTDWPSQIRAWFQVWTELGWFCKYETAARAELSG